MELCPICRASLNGASICRRCRADLQRVQQIEKRGRSVAGAAMLALARGQEGEACRLLARARTIHATPAVLALAGLVTGSQSPFTSSRPGAAGRTSDASIAF
jgi:hypothetical protein